MEDGLWNFAPLKRAGASVPKRACSAKALLILDGVTQRGYATNRHSVKGKRRAGTPGAPSMESRLLLRLGWRVRRHRLIGWTRHHVRNTRRVRDLAPDGVGDHDSGVIEQETDGPIQFNFRLFVCGLG
jgi:hypothetical protein